MKFLLCLIFCYTEITICFSERLYSHEEDNYFVEGKEICEKKGWTLPKIENKQDENELVEKFTDFEISRCWLDLKETIYDWKSVIG